MSAMNSPMKLAILKIFMFVTFGLTTLADGAGRGRRSDDSNPLEAALATLSQRVDQLSARNGALEAQLALLTSRLAATEAAVAFTVRYNNYDITNLGQGQILKFDRIVLNAGNGYNLNTGMFTAPSAGTYAFYMNVAQHSGEAGGTCIEVNLVQNGTPVDVIAAACSHYMNTGSNMAVLHLQEGNTVHVQMRTGNKLHGDYHTTFSGMKLSPL